MQLQTPSSPITQLTPPFADAGAFVREMAFGRSQALTPDQERRLVKTLERLHPAADVALAGAASSKAGSPGRSFESVLVQLSDA